MKYMLIREYFSGKTLMKKKLNAKCQSASLSYAVENGRMVVRDYHTNSVLQTFKTPTASIEFEIVHG